jgi:hypothetical protein
MPGIPNEDNLSGADSPVDVPPHVALAIADAKTQGAANALEELARDVGDAPDPSHLVNVVALEARAREYRDGER